MSNTLRGGASTSEHKNKPQTTINYEHFIIDCMVKKSKDTKEIKENIVEKKAARLTRRANRAASVRLLIRFLRGSRGFIVASILISLVAAIFEMISPKVISFTVDSVLGDKKPNLPQFAIDAIEKIGGKEYLAKNLWVIAVFVLIVSVMLVILRYAQNVLNSRGSQTLIETMRNDLYGHIEHLPYSWHMKNQTGDIIQRCTSDVEMVNAFLSRQLVSIVRIVLFIIVAMVFMFDMNVRLASVAAATLPIIVAYSAFFHGKIGLRFRECDESEGKLSSITQENLTGVRVVRAFGRERYERERFERQNNEYCSLLIKLCRLLAAFWATGDLISGLQVMLIIILGTIFTVRGDMSTGDFMAFVSYNSMLIWPVRRLGRMVSEMSKAGVSIERIRYIMDSPRECDKPDAIEPPMTGDIKFENVSFSYDGTTELLHNVSFTVKAGTTLGIIGGTGSGKSTLMHLLCRLYDLPPENGRITIGGVDIADMKASWVRCNIGIVLQEPFLFSRTIEENIGIARADITMEEIREAARIACLDETIESFSSGYATVVGERGVTLSGGQKQRAAIARMLTQKAPIMIFDDSLSAVDAETDAKIRRALSEAMGKSTVIIISHRTSTLMAADKIIVLDRGRVREEGTHEELIAKGGLYKRINDIQMANIDVDDDEEEKENEMKKKEAVI
jgi:ATP-binding cassette subfamily B protein